MKALHIGADHLRHGADTLQHHIPQHFLPDVVGRADAAPAFVFGADVAVLTAIIPFAGGEVKLAPAVSTEQQPRKQSLPLTLGDAAFVFPQFLHPIPLFLRDDSFLCTGQDEHILLGVGDTLLQLVGL